MESQATSRRVKAFTFTETGFSPVDCSLIEEVPLEIIINNNARILIMFTPSMVRELVTGFLFTEGYIKEIQGLLSCEIKEVYEKNEDTHFEAHIVLRGTDLIRGASLQDRVSFSSCGICGRDNYQAFKRGVERVKSHHRFSMDMLRKLPDQLDELQGLYQRTKASHAAIMFDSTGKPVIIAEDMGRHNAVDKVVGRALLDSIPTGDKVLLSSGRASLEMIIKAARAGFPFFIAMSRPTSKAVQAAKFYNITLIDFAKETNRIYSHARRIYGF